jgi:hypothetical protein
MRHELVRCIACLLVYAQWKDQISVCMRKTILWHLLRSTQRQLTSGLRRKAYWRVYNSHPVVLVASLHCTHNLAPTLVKYFGMNLLMSVIIHQHLGSPLTPLSLRCRHGHWSHHLGLQ